MITLRDRSPEQIAELLKARGVATARTYPETIGEQVPARSALRVSELPNSRAICKSVINLPLFAYIKPEEVDEAARAFLDVLT